MIKIFISQPMKDKTKEEIMAERNMVVEWVSKKFSDDAEIIDSYFEDFEDANIKNKPLAYLAKSIALLATADIAVFCAGWENYRGCKIEHRCAADYGIELMELSEPESLG